MPRRQSIRRSTSKAKRMRWVRNNENCEKREVRLANGHVRHVTRKKRKQQNSE